MPTDRRALEGVSVVVTRNEPGRLGERLHALGAYVVHLPTVAFVDADDHGAALDRAVVELTSYSWLVVTSATAVRRLGDALTRNGLPLERPRNLEVAAVGPATAQALGELGWAADLVPGRAVGEALVEAFPIGTGRVLQVRPEVARDVVGPGLRAKGWDVAEVAAYRTVTPPVVPSVLDDVTVSDVVTFLSPSAVDGFVAQVDPTTLSARVVSIGPVTSAALARYGVRVDSEAMPHCVDGVVAAVVAVTGGHT